MQSTEVLTETFLPVNAKTGKVLATAMQELFLTGTVFPAGARLFVRHTFVSAEQKPLEVIYTFMLPRDAALRRFKIVGKDFEAHSQLLPVKEAKQKYERGIERGNLSVLTEQYRDGYVSLNVGNLKPGEPVVVQLEIIAGVDVMDDGLRLRFPFTLAPVYHSKMRVATLDENNFELELPQEEFGDLLLPPFSTTEENLHRIGFRLELALGPEIQAVSSPSHPISFASGANGKPQVSLAPAADIPNRDLILDVQLRESFEEVFTEIDPQGKGQLLCIIGSDRFGAPVETPRQVVFVLDRSGSMSGEPIAQARAALLACLGALAPEDKIGLIAFDNRPEYYNRKLVPADNEQREALRNYIEKIEARGGTELLMGLRAAHNMIGDEGGEIFLITDGQVGGTEDIGYQVRHWNVRIHILGIGSASQDRFLSLLARQTGGISRFVSPAERVDLAAWIYSPVCMLPVPRRCTLQLRASKTCSWRRRQPKW